jgi:hypothetical protein
MIALWFYSFWPCLIVGILVPIMAIILVQTISRLIQIKQLPFEKSKPDMLIAFAFFAFSAATVYFQPINPLFYRSTFQTEIYLYIQ